MTDNSKLHHLHEHNAHQSTTDTGQAMEQAMYGPSRNQLSHRQLSSYISLLVVLVILAVLVTLYNPNPVDSSAIVSVSITNANFTPASLVVKPGTAVTWVNNDNAPHQVAADPYPVDSSIPGFDSTITLQPNSTYTYTFSKAGTYTYHDQLNPFNLKGVVEVR